MKNNYKTWYGKALLIYIRSQGSRRSTRKAFEKAEARYILFISLRKDDRGWDQLPRARVIYIEPASSWCVCGRSQLTHQTFLVCLSIMNPLHNIFISLRAIWKGKTCNNYNFKYSNKYILKDVSWTFFSWNMQKKMIKLVCWQSLAFFLCLFIRWCLWSEFYLNNGLLKQ